MGKCFVIQPFSSKYQKLYEDVFQSAIEKAGLVPYKVDDDPAATVLIESIENEIHAADFCFADISELNANVWFELGFAIAANKGVCIVCSRQAEQSLPFDVRHRKVLFYDSESPSDFIKLAKNITNALTAMLEKGRIVSKVKRQIQTEENIHTESGKEFTGHELTALSLIAAEQGTSTGTCAIYSIKNSMNQAQYNDVATALAIHSLERKNLVMLFADSIEHDSFDAISLTESGWNALASNESKLSLKRGKALIQDFSTSLDDEIPF